MFTRPVLPAALALTLAMPAAPASAQTVAIGNAIMLAAERSGWAEVTSVVIPPGQNPACPDGRLLISASYNTMSLKLDGTDRKVWRLPKASPDPNSGADANGDIALDADVTMPDPARFPPPPGGYPLIVMMHGCCSGNKTGWEAATAPSPAAETAARRTPTIAGAADLQAEIAAMPAVP